MGIQTVNTIPIPHSRPAESPGQRYRFRGSASPSQAGGESERREASAGRHAHQEQRQLRRRLRRRGQRKKPLRPFKQAGSVPGVQQVRARGFESGFRGDGSGPDRARGQDTTLGNHCSGYGAQIQQLVASHWNTDTVDNRIRTAPTVTATFELMRDGSDSECPHSSKAVVFRLWTAPCNAPSWIRTLFPRSSAAFLAIMPRWNSEFELNR